MSELEQLLDGDPLKLTKEQLNFITAMLKAADILDERKLKANHIFLSRLGEFLSEAAHVIRAGVEIQCRLLRTDSLFNQADHSAVVPDKSELRGLTEALRRRGYIK